MNRLFGTDGIRGEANLGNMTPEMAFRLGAAITHQIRKKKHGHMPRIVVGKDTRLSGYMIETALASGICSQGGRVMLCGPLPTPGVAHITMSMRADAGVVISASHNAYQDNGIKVFAHDGFKLPDAEELALEKLILGNALDKNRPTASAVGSAERIEDAQGRYISFAKQTFPSNMDLDGIKIVLDAANGAAYKVAPAALTELGAHVISLSVKPDGKNINDNCGALHPETCAKEVVKQNAQLGITLDGDADRLILIDGQGQVVDGDVIMALCAVHLLKQGKLKNNTLVTTVMSNLGLEHAIHKAGGKMIRTQVGDRYVVEHMRKHGLNFGGEQSGHLVFLDHTTTGDGLIAALQILALMKEKKSPLSKLADKALVRVPQILLNKTFAKKVAIEELKQTSKLITKCEKELGGKGRILVRWSGTEPKLRVMIEGPSETKIKSMANLVMQSALDEIP